MVGHSSVNFLNTALLETQFWSIYHSMLMAAGQGKTTETT